MWHLSSRVAIDGPGGVEIHVAGGAEGVIRAQDGLERRRAVGRGDDGLVDAVGGVVRELDQQQQLREGVVLERDAFGQPAFGDAEQLREEPGLVVAVVVAEVFFQRELGQQEGDFVRPAALEIVEGVDAGFADDGRVLGLGGNVGGGEGQPGFVGERGGEPLAGQVVAVAEQPGKGDLAGDAAFERPDAGGQRARLGVRGRAAARDEGERHAVDLGIFGLEMALVVGGITHAPQGAADHLLAEQLRAEGADAEDVGDGVGVPAFGEHGDADHAFDVFAELAGLADGVHHFAEQVFIGEVFGIAAGEADAVFGLELVDFAGGDLLEVVAHGLAGFELLAVHQDRVRAVQPAAVAVVVAEDGQVARPGRWSVRRSAFPSRR